MEPSTPISPSEKRLSKSNPLPESSFQYRLFSILEEAKYNEIISWNSEGLGIEIKSRERLLEEVLPLFFRYKSISTFFKQLIYYGFKCHKSEQGHCFYSHPLFQRGKRSLLSKMAKKNMQSTFSSEPVEFDSPCPMSCELSPRKRPIDELEKELRLKYLLIERLLKENIAMRAFLKKVCL